MNLNVIQNFVIHNFLINNNLNKINEDQREIDEYPYILEEKKIIKFIRYDNTIRNVKIPISLKKNELYSTANNYKLRRFSDIILSHKNISLNKDESSINEIKEGDEIYIIEELKEIDSTYYKKYLEKHQNDKKINVNFEKTDGLKKNMVFSEKTTIKEMIKIYLFETDIPEKYKNEFCFTYNAESLNINDTSSLSQKGLKEQSQIMVIEKKIVENDKDKIKGKELKVSFKINKNIIKTCCIGTLNQVKDIFSHLHNLPNSEEIINIEINGNIFENDETRTFSSFGIREDFTCKILLKKKRERTCCCTIL